jgi:hypothetical protein
MEDPKSLSLPPTQTGLQIPSEWEEHFLIKRIDEESIKITLKERDFILKALNNGDRFIQIGKYTLMLNSIKSIDPVYEPDNIPPRPNEIEEKYSFGMNLLTNKEENYINNKGDIVERKKLIQLWDSLYKNEKNQPLLKKQGRYLSE